MIEASVQVPLGKLGVLRTTLVYNQSEGLVRVTVSTVRTPPEIFHEFRGCSGRFFVEGNGDGRSLQEFEL